MDLKQIPITWKGRKWRKHLENVRYTLQQLGCNEWEIEHTILLIEIEKRKWDERFIKKWI